MCRCFGNVGYLLLVSNWLTDQAVKWLLSWKQGTRLERITGYISYYQFSVSLVTWYQVLGQNLVCVNVSTNS